MPVQTMFLGTSTVFVTDGDSSILVDGFLSRPSFLKILHGRLAPDPRRIAAVLARAGIDRLDLVVVSHSHIDHALDCVVVAEQTGARLAGSSSTLMIARGQGFDESRFDLIEARRPTVIGSFTVTPIEALHSNGDRYPGEIEQPLAVPAKASAFRTGACFDFHFAHPHGSVLVHPSANFIAGALDGYRTDVLYLGAGAAGQEDEAWRNKYWDETVVATGATTVYPVHWDRFWKSLDDPLVPLPHRFDDFDATMDTWVARANAARIEVLLPQLWVRETVEVS